MTTYWLNREDNRQASKQPPSYAKVDDMTKSQVDRVNNAFSVQQVTGHEDRKNSHESSQSAMKPLPKPSI